MYIYIAVTALGSHRASKVIMPAPHYGVRQGLRGIVSILHLKVPCSYFDFLPTNIEREKYIYIVYVWIYL